MKKYFVSSGSLEFACFGDSAKDAALIAFSKAQDIEELGKVTVVSERGFNTDHDNDVYFLTCDLLEETDQLENFQSVDWL